MFSLFLAGSLCIGLAFVIERGVDLAAGLLIFGWAFVLIWIPMVVYTQRKIHPRALFTLFFAELWERFSFYGFRSLFILYMTKVLFEQMAQGDSDARAFGIYGAYNALLYATPIIGGLLADRVMGFRNAILTGGIFMAAAQFTLATTAGANLGELPFFLGIAMLTVGNGLFKPNMSSLLGTFYEKNDTRKDSAFTIFYMGINIGAFLAPITCGYLGERIDWSLGFLTAGLGMVLGLIVFWRNMRKFEDKGNPPDVLDYKKPFRLGLSKKWLVILGAVAAVPALSLLINAEGITNYIMIIGGVGIIGYLLYTAITAKDKVEGQRMIAFVFFFFFHMIFWALFEQAGGSLYILTDRYINLHGLQASQLLALNPLFMIILAPVFAWIWVRLGKANREPNTMVKFFAGFLQISLGYFIVVLGIRSVLGTVNEGALIPMFFLIGMYLFHTTGELSLSPVGLSVVTKLAPAKVVGFVMGAWFLSIAFAHKIAGELGKLIASPGEDTSSATALKAFADVYLIWGVYAVLGAALLLLILTPFLKKWMQGIH